MRRSSFFLRVVEYGVSSILMLAAAVCIFGLWDRDDRAEVAVVLGNEVLADGAPSPRLAARLDRAVELYRARRCGMIIVSGGKGASGHDEATIMGRYLARHGIPARNIVYDHKGFSTWETARFTGAYMRRYSMDSVIVVTQYFHVARADLAMRLTGVRTVGSASPFFFEWRDIYSAFRELPAIVWYCARWIFH